MSVDDLAQEIRRVDGNHSLGAGALAEALFPFIASAIREAENAKLEEAAGRVDRLLEYVRGGANKLHAIRATAVAARDIRSLRHQPEGGAA